MLISSEIASDWRTIGEHPQLIECTGICVSEPGAWIETKGYRRYLDIVKKKMSGHFSLNSARVRVLGWHFFGIFLLFFKGGLWSKSFIENI